MDVVEGIDIVRNTVPERRTPQTVTSRTFCARSGLETRRGTGTYRLSHIPFCITKQILSILILGTYAVGLQ